MHLKVKIIIVYKSIFLFVSSLFIQIMLYLFLKSVCKGAKGVKNMFPKVKSAVPDRDRYVPEKDLPENLEPKSNKQKKKEAWRAKMKSMIN